MEIIDVILLMIVFGFTLIGLWSGFIRSVGSLAGFFIGIYVAGQAFVAFDISLSMKIIAFITIYFIIGQLVGLLFYVLQKMFNLISIIPFTKSINRLLGALLGFLEGMLIISGAILMYTSFSIDKMFNPFENSYFAPWALKFAGFIRPLISDVLNSVL